MPDAGRHAPGLGSDGQHAAVDGDGRAVDVGRDPDAGDPLPLDEAMTMLISAASHRRMGQISNQVWARATGSARLQTMIAERHAQVCR